MPSTKSSYDLILAQKKETGKRSITNNKIFPVK